MEFMNKWIDLYDEKRENKCYKQGDNLKDPTQGILQFPLIFLWNGENIVIALQVTLRLHRR
jgi:hypothetical protein